MSDLYLRRAQIVIGAIAGIPGLSIAFSGNSSLRLAFKVERNAEATTPNTAEVQIYNLSEMTRERMLVDQSSDFVGPPLPLGSKRFRRPITLEAGYKDNTGRVFDGHSDSITHSREGADWITRILAADGHLANEPRISLSMAKGTPTSVLLGKMLDSFKGAMGGALDTATAKARTGDWGAAVDALKKGLDKGTAMDGPILAQLDRLAATAGYEVSVQNGELQVLKVNETLARKIVVLTPSTGLVGPVEPVRDEKRPGDYIIKARSLLQASIQIGARVQIQSKAVSGFFKVRKTTDTGDTHGPEWHTEFEAVQV